MNAKKNVLEISLPWGHLKIEGQTQGSTAISLAAIGETLSIDLTVDRSPSPESVALVLSVVAGNYRTQPQPIGLGTTTTYEIPRANIQDWLGQRVTVSTGDFNGPIGGFEVKR